MPASSARSRFSGESSISTSIPISQAAGDLVVGAVELVVGQADLRRATARWRRARRASRWRGDVDEVARPRASARIVSTAPGYGSAARTCSRAWVSCDAARVTCSGRSAVDLPRDLLARTGSVDAEAALRDGRRAGPSSGAASSRCRWRCARAAGTVARVPASHRAQLAAAVPTRLLRPGADDDLRRRRRPDLDATSTGRRCTRHRSRSTAASVNVRRHRRRRRRRCCSSTASAR